MSLYYETTSYNYSPNGTGDTTTLPIKKSFIFFFFVFVIGWQESPVANKKKVLPSFVKVKALLFSIYMDILISHVCSNHKPSYTQENH